jgi:hypothetical protein
LKREAGIPEELTRRLVSGLAGVDHLGTLLKVDDAVEQAINATDLEFERSHGQGDLFGGFPKQQVKLSLGEAKATVLDKLEQFLARHSASDDLGLRLDGEQLAAGVRFVRIAKEGIYDVVVGNPPYHGVGKLKESGYYVSKYPNARPDLFAGFYLRGLELARDGGTCSMITLSNWMFLGVFWDFRRAVKERSLVALADLGKAAFSTGGTLISTASTVFRKAAQTGDSVGLRLHTPDEVVRDDGQPGRTHAALLLQRGRYDFDPKGFEVIEGEPIMYSWSKEFLARYASAPKLGQLSQVRQGLATANNSRFLRRPWEIPHVTSHSPSDPWVPYIKGAAGREWFEPLDDLVKWNLSGAEIRHFFLDGRLASRPQNIEWYFRLGIAFTKIGASFSARLHRYPSIFDVAGQSVFPNVSELASTVCSMNSAVARHVLQSLNPTVNFQVGDVVRLPVFRVKDALRIVDVLSNEFAAHEAGREASIEYCRPGPSSWRYAQDWAQRAVDRPDGDPLPPYESEHDRPAPECFISFGIGVALGRFGANGEGILDDAPASALPAGVLFVSAEGRDNLDHPFCSQLHDAWKDHGAQVGGGDDLRTYLRTSFFTYHKKLYENRPIYFPLSSAKKSFVALVSIHRWKDDTLNVLLADHLVPEKRRLEGELEDLRKARTQSAAKGKAEKRFAEVQKLLEELSDFIDKVTQIAECGPPPPDDKTPKREVDTRFVMDLDDGVMVNSSALWPLLEPQWKDPKKWWKELATAQGRKDYDWAHLAARYFPKRVRAKCVEDPSLAVAHKCFWELHPAKAYAWELRLQDEIRPNFTIDEPGSDAARARFLAEHPQEAKDALANEMKRRERKAAKAEEDDEAEPLFATTDADEDEGHDVP